MADSQMPVPESHQGEGDAQPTSDEMREMIQSLLNKVDNLERQLANQDDPPVTDDDTDAFEDDDGTNGFTDYAPDSIMGEGHPSQVAVMRMDASDMPFQPVTDQMPVPAPPMGQTTESVTDPYPMPFPQEGVPMPPDGLFAPTYDGYQVGCPSPEAGVPLSDSGMPDDPGMPAPPVPDGRGGIPWRKLSEGNIGRYGTGLVASLLVIMGIWAGAQLLWSQIPGLARMLILFAMGAVAEGVAASLAARSEERRKNGFLTSLSATGAIVSFLSLAIGGMLYGLYGPPLMGILFIAWFFVQTLVARLVGSRLFYAVTYAGGAVTMILEATQVISSANPITCLAFSLTALVIPLVGLIDRNRNPAVPYASAIFSLISSVVAVMLVGVAWQDRSTLVSTPEFETMAKWLMQNADIALVAVTGFISGCAVTLGTRVLSDRNLVAHVNIRTILGTLGLVQMLRAANCLPWECGLVPNATFCICALLIVIMTGVAELRVPAAFLTALSMWHLLDGTEAFFTELVGTPVAGAVPALAVSCLLPLLPAVRRSAGNMVATMVFVIMSCLPMLTGDWASNGIAYALPATVFSLFACLATFKLAMAWIGMQTDAAIRESESSVVNAHVGRETRRQSLLIVTKRRTEIARRLVPLGIALLASLAFIPVLQSSETPVTSDMAPAVFSLLVSLHMMAGIGFGTGGWGLPGTEQETRRWNGFQGQYSADDDMMVARTVRGWNIAMLFLAYAWALMAHGTGSTEVSQTIGNVAYSMSLVLVPATLIAHATSRRSLWAVIAATCLSHISFCIVAGLWTTGNIGLVASCLSIALALGFVGIGFKARKADIRMTGLVTMILFVIKIALFDLPKAGATELNAFLLIGTGALVFAISFAYNRIDRMYGEDDPAIPSLDGEDEFEDVEVPPAYGSEEVPWESASREGDPWEASGN